MNTFKAYRVHETAKGFVRNIEEIPFSVLPENEVLVKVCYSGINYKDLLSSRGNKGVSKNYPHTPGIDAAGRIEEDASGQFKPGEEVIVMGYDLGMNTHGAFGEYIRVPAAWVMPLPEGIDLHQAMSIGTSGFTAALGVLKMLRCGQKPEMGPILVTGATGGVGSYAVQLLRLIGFDVIASTGKLDEKEYLLALGATQVIERSEIMDSSGKPLLRKRWAGAFDTVGGATLVSILKACGKESCVATCGNVTGPVLETSMLPFILNGVNLLGINAADTPMPFRKEIWKTLIQQWNYRPRTETESLISLEEVEDALAKMEQGKHRGRFVIAL